MNAIEIKGLSKYYGKSRGIEDVSFNVQEGEIFGFIGPNGAGKSTTIRTLLSLIKPSGGTATIFGKDIVKDAVAIRQDIGYLPSEVFYYENMKVIDLLKYSASFYKKDCTKRIHELAKLLEVDLNRKIDDLSYGNKKKVGIIQGLLHEPKLIILDEPTGGLDPLMQNRFFDLLLEENKRGATILFSSHILSEVQKICNRVAIIKEGRIVKVEEVHELMQNSYLKVELQSDEPLALAQVSGVRNIEVLNGHTRFLYEGNINELIAYFAKHSLSYLSIQEPDLEEIFMHYYVKGE